MTFCVICIMKKVSSTEAIRRGFSILGSVRSPMSSMIFSKDFMMTASMSALEQLKEI